MALADTAIKESLNAVGAVGGIGGGGDGGGDGGDDVGDGGVGGADAVTAAAAVAAAAAAAEYGDENAGSGYSVTPPSAAAGTMTPLCTEAANKKNERRDRVILTAAMGSAPATREGDREISEAAGSVRDASATATTSSHAYSSPKGPRALLLLLLLLLRMLSPYVLLKEVRYCALYPSVT